MRKEISFVLLLALTVAVVSPRGNTVSVEDDTGIHVAMKASDDVPVFNLVAIGDAFVPEVRGFTLQHAESVESVVTGHEPDMVAMVRGPTEKATRLNMRSRDRPMF